MKKIFYATLALILVSCGNLAYAQQETNKIMQELNKELEQEKVFLPKELRNMDRSLRNCLEQGVKKEDLKAILIDLKKKESNAKDTKKTIDLMIDLVKSGIAPQEAGNIVSQAAHLAKAQGLKGTALAARVHEAIQIRKAEHERLKQQKKEMQEQQMQHKEKHEIQIQAQEIFQEKVKGGESHGMGAGHGRGRK